MKRVTYIYRINQRRNQERFIGYKFKHGIQGKLKIRSMLKKFRLANREHKQQIYIYVYIYSEK